MPTPPKIGFITAADLSRFFPSKTEPLFTDDDQIAADALRQEGCIVEPVIWGTPVEALKAQNFSMLIIRSPWDYSDNSKNRKDFFAWLDAVSSANIPLENPLPVLMWNLDKHYLKDLEQQGVAIVPTEILKRHEQFDFIGAYNDIGAYVVKPCISAGARDTFWINSVTDAAQFAVKFGALRRDRDFLIQPFIREILTAGEWSLTYFNGNFAHAILKKPKAGSWYVQDELGGTTHSATAPANVIALADQALKSLGYTPLYARIDIIARAAAPLLGELELVEPELFFLERPKNQPKEQGQLHVRSVALFCEAVKNKLATML